MKVSHSLLSREALNGLLDEFITRDSVVWDGTLDDKRKRLIQELERDRAFIVFNEKDGSTHILTAEEYAKTETTADS